MSMTNIFWVFFIIIALQPVIHRRILEASRRRLIAKIEKQRGSRVILLVHRQETMSLLGFPFFRYIDVNDSEEVIRAIHMTDSDVPLDLMLHTPGGLVLASLQIARAISKHPAKVTVHVRQVRESVRDLLAKSYPEEKAEELSKVLSEGIWTHDHPISCEEARELGLKISTEMPKEFLQLMSMYPQPTRRQPSVEYLPGPRHRQDRTG
jgi:ClpP class serine protease